MPRASAAGVYESVKLSDKERILIETSDELNEYFAQRSLLYTDPTLSGLVSQIGSELAPPPTDDYQRYRFFILRDPSPNAFALPNGDVYVHTGMLARLEDESQLAALLAHEINHVAGHHAILDYRDTHNKIVAGMVLTGVFGGLGAMMSAGLYTSMYGFSRELEQEADDRGIGLLEASRYDPHALPEVFDMLAKDYEGLMPRVPTVWSTHPEIEARAAHARKLLENVPTRERDSRAFESLVLPLQLTTVEDYVQDDYPYTALALSRALLEVHPGQVELVKLLGDAWQALGPRPEQDPSELSNAAKRRNVARRVFKTRQERMAALAATPEGQAALASNVAHARDAYLDAIALDDTFAPAHRGLGEVYEALDAPRDAARAYVEYLRLAPDAADRGIVIERLKVLRTKLSSQGGPG
jgi:tetratricopeptide (TPR) repeat protein